MMSSTLLNSKGINHFNFKGLVCSPVAPTRRTLCLLFSFVFGTLELTAGSVLYHLIVIHPKSEGKKSAPSLALSISLIVLGIITLVSTFLIAIDSYLDLTMEMEIKKVTAEHLSKITS